MTYIDFGSYYNNHSDHWVRSKWFVGVREWLDINAGVEEIDWFWLRGDLFAKGVNIANRDVALLFKLTFEV